MAEDRERQLQTARLHASVVQIWQTRLSERQDLVEPLWSALPKSEQQQADRFRIPACRERYVLGRAMLRELLSAQLGAAPSKIELHYTPHGKPRLALPDSDLAFNLSHSGDQVILALAKAMQIGVDVEQIRVVERRDQIAEGILGSSELAQFTLLGDADRQQAFFRVWTRKEAIVKAHGRGLLFPLTEVEVSLTTEEPLLRRFQTSGRDDAPWHLSDVEVGEGYVSALATSVQPREIQLHSWRPSLADP